jgi:hypothetical protein
MADGLKMVYESKDFLLTSFDLSLFRVLANRGRKALDESFRSCSRGGSLETSCRVQHGPISGPHKRYQKDPVCCLLSVSSCLTFFGIYAVVLSVSIRTFVTFLETLVAARVI